MNLADINRSRATQKTGKVPKRRTGREGRSLETLVLRSQGTEVVLTKIGQLAKRLPGGRIVPQSGPVDIVGVHISSGKMLYFDCKQGRSVTRLETRKDHLPEHQRLNIIRYGEAGAIAGILSECTKTRELYWIRWDQLVTRRPSMPWDECWNIGDSRHPVCWKSVVLAADFWPAQYPEQK